jgi:UDP-N-acetylmuramoylalanine--D-glutamate ligase
MAATSVAKLMQIRKATIRESLSSFQGVEHRLEKVEDPKCTIYQ